MVFNLLGFGRRCWRSGQTRQRRPQGNERHLRGSKEDFSISFLKYKRFHLQGERGPDGVTGVPGPRGDKVHNQRTDHFEVLINIV